MSVKIKPPYKHLVQKRMFCGPTCIQMILFRNELWVDQSELARGMGVKIREKDKGKFEFALETVPDDSIEFGFKLSKFKDEKVKSFLSKNGLSYDVVFYSDIGDVKDLISSNLRKGRDVMINFHVKLIWEKDFGHYVLASEIDEENEVLTVCDPYFDSKNFWKIKISKLEEAMTDKWDGRERGIVIFTYNK